MVRIGSVDVPVVADVFRERVGGIDCCGRGLGEQKKTKSDW